MIFYSLALAQGVQYLIWYVLSFAGRALVNLVAKECEFDSKWGVNCVQKYLMETEFKFLNDLSSNQGWDLIRHATDLLDSDSEEDFLCGARMLATFINKGELPVQELRLSRRKIQRLVMALSMSCTDPDDWEMRVLAAKIRTHCQGHLSFRVPRHVTVHIFTVESHRAPLPSPLLDSFSSREARKQNSR